MKLQFRPAGARVRRLRLGVLVLIFALIMGSCGEKENTTAPATTSEFLQSQNEIARTSPLFVYWQNKFPGSEWASLAKADLNNDNRDDLVIIYTQGENKFYFVVVENLASGYMVAEPNPAPVLDQVVAILDLGGRPQNEFSISGRKGDEVGMAIFVLEDHKVIMLFTSEYGDCC